MLRFIILQSATMITARCVHTGGMSVEYSASGLSGRESLVEPFGVVGAKVVEAMSNSTWLAAFVAGVAIVQTATWGMAQVDWRQEARQYGWLLSLAEGQRQARLERKPLMVVIRCVP